MDTEHEEIRTTSAKHEPDNIAVLYVVRSPRTRCVIPREKCLIIHNTKCKLLDKCKLSYSI